MSHTKAMFVLEETIILIVVIKCLKKEKMRNRFELVKLPHLSLGCCCETYLLS